MTARQYILPLAGELLVDLFAGANGAATQACAGMEATA